MKKLVISLVVLIFALSCSKGSKENKTERISKVDSGNFTEVQASKNEKEKETQSQESSYSKGRNETKNQSNSFNVASNGNYTKELKAKMKKVEERLQSKLDSGVTSEMVNANDELYKAWDVELNKVYKLLMERLPNGEKEKLKNTQRAWVKNKEVKANEAAKEAEGGTLANVLYSGTIADLIKNRTIELAKMYDDLK
ncbi:lysozyme inhibitor LprI family protein [Leptotrichia sp. oral taxon 847]|uniref:lysozyme inhibitor LprI family protein n=1 Tax=Leptotrichia sp. oral taxon 847 TaxID=1785996 RepID=UPI000A90CD4A|nr:lysozyme inhibitor LprI family protein [Leptotrichia sp. oral taxon 847]